MEEHRTQVHKLPVMGPAACLFLLSNIPTFTSATQVRLGEAMGMWAFDAAGFGAAMQEKAGRMPNRLHTDANPGSAFSKF